jgi:hypothetical protein
MKRFDRYMSSGLRVAGELVVAIFGAAGARASLINMKGDWKRISLLDK